MMEVERGCALLNVTVRDGKRVSIFRAYTGSVAERPNLTIMHGAMVTRLIYQGNRVRKWNFSAKAGLVQRTPACRSRHPSVPSTRRSCSFLERSSRQINPVIRQRSTEVFADRPEIKEITLRRVVGIRLGWRRGRPCQWRSIRPGITSDIGNLLRDRAQTVGNDWRGD
jgi:hypothetical protein